MRNPMTMGRTELIDALRSYTTHGELAVIMKADTAFIRGQYARYASSEADKNDTREDSRYAPPTRMLRSVAEREVILGIDWGYAKPCPCAKRKIIEAITAAIRAGIIRL